MKLLSKSFVALAFACLGTILFSISAHATVELAFDGAENLFEQGSDSIFKFAPDGSKSTLATEGSFSSMAIDRAGNVFAVDGDTIVKIASDGNKSTFTSGFGYGNPFDLTFDDKGNLFVAVGDSEDESILRFTPEGAKSTFASGLSPAEMVFDSAGNLFVADYRSHSIFKFLPNGKKLPFATGIGHAASLIFDHKGNLFVADLEKDSIFKFTPNGVRSTFASKLSPEAMIFDKADDLFVALPHSVLKFAPDRTKTTFAADIPQFAAFAFNKAGDLFVADSATDSIFKFSGDGTKSTFSAPPPSPSSADKAESPSPDGRFAFIATAKGEQQAFDLIEKESGKVLARLAESDPEPAPSARFNMEVLWRPDSKAFALTGTLWKRGSYVAVYLRDGATFREVKLPELVADIPAKVKGDKSFPHVAELNSQSAKRWQKDGSLVVEIENMIDGEGGSITATRTAVLGFDRSGKARIVKSTIKFETEAQ